MIITDSQFLQLLREAIKNDGRWLIVTNDKNNQPNNYTLPNSFSESQMKDFLKEKLSEKNSKAKRESSVFIGEITGISKFERMKKISEQFFLVKRGNQNVDLDGYLSHKEITKTMKESVQPHIIRLNEELISA